MIKCIFFVIEHFFGLVLQSINVVLAGIFFLPCLLILEEQFQYTQNYEHRVLVSCFS